MDAVLDRVMANIKAVMVAWDDRIHPGNLQLKRRFLDGDISVLLKITVGSGPQKWIAGRSVSTLVVDRIENYFAFRGFDLYAGTDHGYVSGKVLADPANVRDDVCLCSHVEYVRVLHGVDTAVIAPNPRIRHIGGPCAEKIVQFMSQCTIQASDDRITVLLPSCNPHGVSVREVLLGTLGLKTRWVPEVQAA